MWLCEYSVTYGYVVATAGCSILVYTPNINKEVVGVLKFWCANVPHKMIIHVTSAQHARNLTNNVNTLRAINIIEHRLLTKNIVRVCEANSV